ncbi:MAG TPA: SGNH hydrolase domain-containing protein [Acidimicrobiia bacterium]|nr:SGNH hydrolase domain-containing protein [Acidimicrobiia bacterium]
MTALAVAPAVLAAAVIMVGPGTSAAGGASRPTAPAATPAASAPAVGAAAPPHRVLVIGDSLAESLLPGLAASAAAHDVSLFSRAYGGCGLLTGIPIDPTGQPYPWGQACSDSRPGWQTQAVQDLRPDVVLWLSAAWDERDRLVDGAGAQIGTVAGNRIILQLIDQSAQRLTATGARLVFVIAAPDRGSQLAADPTRNPRLAELNRLLRLYAAFHQLQVVDLAPIICPGAMSVCPETVNGVVMRPDGYHVGSNASPIIAEQVLPQVLAWNGPNAADGGVAAGTYASLNARDPSTWMWSELSHPWRQGTP